MAEEPANVAEEIQQEEVIQPQEIAEQSQTQEETPVPQEVSDKERNFLRLRESTMQLEKENESLRATIQRQKSPPTKAPEMDDIGIDDDDIVEGKVVKKLYHRLQNLERTYQTDMLKTVPERLRNKFSDFDQVVSPENVEKLKHSEPELYASITSGSDLYGKGVSAYKTLKALGIVKNTTNYDAEKEQVRQNQTKPLSTQAIKGQGALSEANIFAKGLTPELKKQLQKEMSEAVKAR